MLAISRVLPGGKMAGSPSPMAWGVSLLVHACVGVACCFLAAGSGSVPEPAGQATPCELPVTLASYCEPERERPIRVEDPEPRPSEPLVLEESPPVEPDTVSLPAPSEEPPVEVAPPAVPEAPAAWRMAASPPPVAPLAIEARAAEEPPPAATLPHCSQEPAVSDALPAGPPAEELPLVEPPEPSTSRAESARGPSAPATPRAGNVPPAYPRLARRQGHEGLVVVSARVSASGGCVAVAILRSSGHGELDEAAAEAVRAWQFRPALLDGAPVEAELEIPIRFRLTD